MGDPDQPKSPAPPRADLPTALAILFMAGLPSLVAWLRFIVLGGDDASPFLRMAVDAGGRVVGVAFPLLFMLLWERRRPRLSWPRRDGLLLGLGFGLFVAAGIFVLYFGWLRSSWLMQAAPAKVVAVLQQMGADQLPGFLLLAVVIVVGNSLLEEYYYRWFIFGRLRAFLPMPAAVATSALAFMAHHLILLSVYLPGQFWTLTVPLCLCVAVGGALWAWLYARTGSLYAPWLSHAIIDAAILVVGWDLMHRAV